MIENESDYEIPYTCDVDFTKLSWELFENIDLFNELLQKGIGTVDDSTASLINDVLLGFDELNNIGQHIEKLKDNDAFCLKNTGGRSK